MFQFTVFIIIWFTTLLGYAADFPVTNTTQFHDALVDSGLEDTDGLKVGPGDTITWANGTYTGLRQLYFNASGLPGEPITLRAESPGGARFEGETVMQIMGAHLVVSGIDLIPGGIGATYPQDSAINFTETSDHCRLTETRIWNATGDAGFSGMQFVELSGTNHRMDHCTFGDKANRKPMVAVDLADLPPNTIANHQIDNNHFSFFSQSSTNGFETIRIGSSSTAQINANIIVENNYFFQCNGDVEVISNKSSQSIFRNNTFAECRGGLSLRHGDENLVEGNYFFGNHVPGTLGVRVMNEDQSIINNYFQHLRGTDVNAVVTLFSGILDTPPTGYHQVKRALIAHNTFVGNEDVLRFASLHNTSSLVDPDDDGPLPAAWYTHSQIPTGNILSNNLFYQNTGTLYDELAPLINTTVEGNLVYDNNILGMPSTGFSVGNPDLVPNGHYRSIGNALTSAAVNAGSTGSYPALSVDIESDVRDSMPDIGADEFNSPSGSTLIDSHDVGATWVTDAELDRGFVRFAESDLIVVEEPTTGTLNIDLPVIREFGSALTTDIYYVISPDEGDPVVNLDYGFVGPYGRLRLPTAGTYPITLPIYSDGVPDGTKSVLIAFANKFTTNGSGTGITTVRKVVIQDSPIDAWTTQHFGNSFVLPEADLFSDPDGDTIPNILEFELLGNPLAQDAEILPEITGGPSGPQLTFTRNLQAKGVEWIVEASDTPSNDPADWTVAATRSATGIWTTTEDVSFSEDTATGDVVISGWNMSPRKFIRYRNAFPWRAPRYDPVSFDEDYQWIEAETALPSTNFEPWEPTYGSTASWNLGISPDDSSIVEPPMDGQLSYPFTLSDPTIVAIWVRLKVPNGSGNSVYMKTSDQPTWSQWNHTIFTSSWEWRKWNQYAFEAGTHSIDVAYRESAFEMDRLLVTSDLAFTPTGVGTTP